MSTDVRPRLVGLDLVRLVGLIAVVTGHVYESPIVSTLIFTWHVPLFFVLTGYLWSPGRGWTTELRRRMTTLGRPYLFWLVAVLVLDLVDRHGAGWQLTVRYALYGGSYATAPFTAFWFVTALLFVAVLYRLLEKAPRWLAASAIAGGLVVNYLAGSQLARIPLALGTALGALVFVAFGQALRAVRPRIPAVAAAVALLATSAVLVAAGSRPVNMKGSDFGTPMLSVLVACAISAALILLGERIGAAMPSTAQDLVSGLAQSLLVVVLTHGAVLQVMREGMQPKDWVPGGLLMVCVAGFVLPAALGAALSRTRFAPITTGLPPSSPGARLAATQRSA